jgi:hypothetical protein
MSKPEWQGIAMAIGCAIALALLIFPWVFA